MAGVGSTPSPGAETQPWSQPHRRLNDALIVGVFQCTERVRNLPSPPLVYLCVPHHPRHPHKPLISVTSSFSNPRSSPCACCWIRRFFLITCFCSVSDCGGNKTSCPGQGPFQNGGLRYPSALSYVHPLPSIRTQCLLEAGGGIKGVASLLLYAFVLAGESHPFLRGSSAHGPRRPATGRRLFLQPPPQMLPPPSPGTHVPCPESPLIPLLSGKA